MHQHVGQVLAQLLHFASARYVPTTPFNAVCPAVVDMLGSELHRYEALGRHRQINLEDNLLSGTPTGERAIKSGAQFSVQSAHIRAYQRFPVAV